ncbi:hypothetical protein ON010_g2307 [Phytophthora cinnamomi]|nr:hypothetical protein ON010_g2307 [Phytophthora cinnamomi]
MGFVHYLQLVVVFIFLALSVLTTEPSQSKYSHVDKAASSLDGSEESGFWESLKMWAKSASMEYSDDAVIAKLRLSKLTGEVSLPTKRLKNANNSRSFHPPLHEIVGWAGQRVPFIRLFNSRRRSDKATSELLSPCWARSIERDLRISSRKRECYQSAVVRGSVLPVQRELVEVVAVDVRAAVIPPRHGHQEPEHGAREARERVTTREASREEHIRHPQTHRREEAPQRHGVLGGLQHYKTRHVLRALHVPGEFSSRLAPAGQRLGDHGVFVARIVSF